MINAKNYSISGKVLPFHELIGLNVLVKASNDVAKKGMNGLIVDETQRTFTLQLNNGMEKIVPKNESTFAFDLGNEEIVELNGNELLYTPVERLKALWGN